VKFLGGAIARLPPPLVAGLTVSMLRQRFSEELILFMKQPSMWLFWSVLFTLWFHWCLYH